ncbi:osmotin-like protein [Triticum urartu]|uniref:osmotin-like protein n=1 Tax=Triticum urartu TaxID=4572 RepID=UPI0020434D9D|nr:osmotin-like protein [Triticum urartu]
MTLTVVNPIWPGIQGNTGSEVLEGGSFFLPSLSHRSFPAPTHAWSSRIWARTGCAIGDCGGGAPIAPARRQGAAAGGSSSPPQVSLHHGGNEQSSYGVSVVDGFNVGLSVTPHKGRDNCPVLACCKDLTQSCPGELPVRT